MRLLFGSSLYVLFACGRYFFGTRAMIAYVVLSNGMFLYNGAVDIDIVYPCSVYIPNSSIVPEMATRPGSATETYTEITAAIINTAIIAYV
jgi:hypothetical protein